MKTKLLMLIIPLSVSIVLSAFPLQADESYNISQTVLQNTDNKAIESLKEIPHQNSSQRLPRNINPPDRPHRDNLIVQWDEALGFPDVINFNGGYLDLFAGGPYSVMINLTNDNGEAVRIIDIRTDHEFFTANFDGEFEIPIDETAELMLVYECPEDAVGEHNAILTIESSDEDNEVIEISMTATSFAPPIIRVEPDNLEIDILQGEIQENTITVFNDGAAILRCMVDTEIISEPDRDRRGGPDEMDCEWGDNLEDDGRDYEWIDLTDFDDVQRIELGNNEVSGGLNLDWEFPFYGDEFERLFVCSDGWLSFVRSEFSNEVPVFPVDNREWFGTVLVCDHDWHGNLDGAGPLLFWTNHEDMAVITWQNWNPRDGGGMVDFQVVLSDEGLITLQYGDGFEDGNRFPEARVGVNGFGDELGYQMVGNGEAEGYLCEERAISFGPASSFSNWLTVEPQEFEVEPAESVDLFVTINMRDINRAGEFEADIIILSNDPANPSVVVPVFFHIGEDWGMWIEWDEEFGYPDIIDWNQAFEDIYAGRVYSIPLSIENMGIDDLIIDDIYTDHEYFQTDFEDEFEVEAGDELIINVLFETPDDGSGEYNATLFIETNDPDAGVWEIALHAEAVAQPDIGRFPANIERDLVVGEIYRRVLHFENHDDEPLRVVIEVEEIREPDRVAVGRSDYDANPKLDPSRDRRSEADDMGYEWRDNDEGDGIDFDWFNMDDVRGVREFRLADNANTGPLELGWDFPFWDREFGQICIHSDGWVSFTYNGNAVMVNAARYPMEAQGAYENTIAVFNNDNRAGTDVWFYTDERNYAVIQWAGNFQYMFQLILESDGLATMQYDENIDRTTGEVGVNLGDGEHGWFISGRDNRYIYEERTIAFGPTNAFRGWIYVEPDEFVLEADEEMDAVLTIDTEGLIPGEYNAELTILTSNREEPAIVIDISVNVWGRAEIIAEWDEDFGFPEVMDWNAGLADVFVGERYEIPVTISNLGTEILIIDDIESDNEYFFAIPNEELELEVGEEVEISFVFEADEAGEYATEMTLFTNDPVNHEFVIPLVGRASMPPEIDVEVLLIERERGISGDVISASNEGESILRCLAQIEWIQQPEHDYLDRSDNVNSVIAGDLPDRDRRGHDRDFTYEWNDNLEDDGPHYGWFDLNHMNNVQQIHLGDNEVSERLNLEWAFSMGERDLEHLYVCSDGWVSFSHNDYADEVPEFPVDDEDWYGTVLLCSHDWHGSLDDAGPLLFWTNERNMAVVTYNNWNPQDGGEPVDFQVIFEHPGRITLQYGEGFEDGNRFPDGTVGVNMFNVNNGFQIVATDEADGYLREGRAISIDRFSEPHQWMYVQPRSFILNPGEQFDLNLVYDFYEPDYGFYEAEVRIYSNDPNQRRNPVRITVSIDISDHWQFDFDWSEDFGFPNLINWNMGNQEIFVNYPYTIPLRFSNDSWEDVTIEDISIDHEYFTADYDDPFVVGPGEEISIDLIFQTPADGAGDYEATLTIDTNERGAEPYTVHVHAAANYEPPIITTDPVAEEEISVAMMINDDPVQVPLLIGNEAGNERADLRFEIEITENDDPEQDNHRRTVRTVIPERAADTNTAKNSAHNQRINIPHPGDDITIRPMDVQVGWCEAEPGEGTVEAGAETEVTLTCSTFELDNDMAYFADLTIISNDPESPEILIPVSLVVGDPNIIPDPGFEETERWHTLTIEELAHDAEAVPRGWEIGVFTPDGVIAGAVVWIEEPTELFAYGADDDHDYYEQGDEFIFRVWDNENDVEYGAEAVFRDGPPFWAAGARTNVYLESWSEREITLNLREYWNMISINVDPRDRYIQGNDQGPDIETMWRELGPEGDDIVLHMKDRNGRFWLPAWDFLNIPYWNLTQGYVVKLAEDREITFEGRPIPADADIPMETGWNMIAYFPTYDLDTSPPDFYVVSPILERVLIAKDGDGLFLSWFYFFSNMHPWTAGQGYQVKISEGEPLIFNYPPEQQFMAMTSPSHDFEAPADGHTPSESNMSLLINSIEGLANAGDCIIQAKASSGRIIGAGRVVDGRCGLAIWGDDDLTDEIEGAMIDEEFALFLGRGTGDAEQALMVTSVHTGSGLKFGRDDFTVIDVSTTPAIPVQSYLSKAYPNPFNNATTLQYGLAEPTEVSIRVYDIEGRIVAELVNETELAGLHSISWRPVNDPAGVYFVKMTAGTGFETTLKVVLMK